MRYIELERITWKRSAAARMSRNDAIGYTIVVQKVQCRVCGVAFRKVKVRSMQLVQ